ncbi:MAG: hypothetical protein D6714_17005, partial [Bacteroidetes bacterium]
MFLTAFAANAQTPVSIELETGKMPPFQLDNAACPDQFAGTISFANFAGQSNDIDLDTIFLCFNDQIDVIHNGDMNLTGDPNPTTAPGVTYAFFACPPGISGPNLTTILTDGCILNNPMPANGLWVTGGGMPNGDQLFANDGTIQSTFNMGDPVLIWFAPMTIDNFAQKEFEADPVSGETGPCVNINTSEAFAVVYLNDIVVTNENPMHTGALCKGSFRVQGGLPEYDPTQNYDITVTNLTTPGMDGEVVSGPAGHLETVIFDVPVAGVYQITIEDGKSCGFSFTMNFSSCTSITSSLPDLNVAPGTNICVDVTNESNFIDIQNMQLSVVWDASILQFDQITNLNPNMPGLTLQNSFGPPVITDALIFSWFDANGTGVSLPNGDVYFTICFNVIGNDGDCSTISFENDPSPIEVFNINDVQLGFNGLDGSVCVSSNTFTIGFTQDSVQCFGEDNGSFTVTVNGGQPPYEVFWQPAAGGSTSGPGTINVDGGSFTAGNLLAGPYAVTITDMAGTTQLDTVEVLGPPQLFVNINEFPAPCFGQLGTLEALIFEGLNPVPNPNDYQVSWSSGDNTLTTSPLLSGLYSVTITAPDGCTATQQSLLSQPPELAPNITFDTASCPGITDGAIFVQVLGGTPDANGDYTINWPTIGPGLVFQNDMSTVSGLEQDCYPLFITDSNNCTFSDTICIPVHKEIDIVPVTVQDVVCAGTCTGEIELVGTTSGEPPALPYNFIWQGNPPPPPAVDDATSTHITGMDAGIYSVTMQDASGCEVDTTFTLIEPPAIQIDTLSIMQASCSPGNDGAISVNATGGTGTLQYVWNTVPAQTTPDVSGLPSGNYVVTVTDDNGCADSASFVIQNPLPPTITELLDDAVSCANSTDGSLTVQATPGDAPITGYDWSNMDSGMTITGLGAGQYIVTVSDGNGCVDIDTAMVTAPPPLQLDSVLTEKPDCPGSGGGNISIFVSGGEAPYFYDWSNGFNGVGVAVIGGGSITAGCYTVTVTDANNCEPLISEICIDDPVAIQVGFSGIQNVSCPENAMGLVCDGGATATAFYSDGTQGNFDFIWGSGETDNDVPFSNASQLCVGMNTLTVSDGMCQLDTTIMIAAPPDLSVDLTITDVSCHGLDDGAAVAMPSGGTGPYTITWETTTGPTINGLSAGTHSVTIEDDNGCSILHNIEIHEPDTLIIQINSNNTNDVTCPGGDDGRISVFAEGGNIILGGESYVWADNVAPTGANMAEGLSAGTYMVTVVDARGCTAELTHVLNEPPPIEFTVDLLNNIGCFNEAATLTVPQVTGGNPTTYQFFIDQGIPRLIGEPAPVFAGDHTVTVIDVINGCTADTTISIFEPLPITIELPDVVVIELGDTLTQLNPTIVSSLPIDTFIWSPATQLSCADCKNPTVKPLNDQLYTLTIVDANGCTATAEVFVEVDRNRNVYLPNVFSPNDDGVNDKFKVFTGIGVERILSFRIFDRWGELLYEDFNLAPSVDGAGEWDGRFRGEKIKPGVFVYIVEVQFLDGTVLT